MKTNFHKKNFALRLALKMRETWTRKWPIGYFDRVTLSLHILYTANQETEGSQDRFTLLKEIIRIVKIRVNLGRGNYINRYFPRY